MSSEIGAVGVVVRGQGSVALMRSAARLAKRFGAACDALYPAWPADMPAGALGRGASGVVIAERREGQARRAHEAERRFTSVLAAEGVKGDFTLAEGEVPEVIARASFNHDLLVVQRVDPADVDDVIEGTQHEHVAMAAICPVLILPPGMETVSLEHVAVAWKETREAARAVKEAMPLLVAAAKVTVVSVAAPAHVIPYQAGMVSYLARHGIEAETIEDTVGHDEGEGLMKLAVENGASLIVMGLYSRPRWFEVVMGGVSRKLVRDCPIPILTAH